MGRDKCVDGFVSKVRDNTGSSLEIAIGILRDDKEKIISGLSAEELMEIHSRLYMGYMKTTCNEKVLEKDLRWYILDRYTKALNESSSEHAKKLIKFATQYSDISSPRILGSG